MLYWNIQSTKQSTMKAIVVLQLAVLVATAIAFEYTEEWEVWKTKHGKIYKDDSEELHRRTVWASNKVFVEEHNKNSDKHGFTVEMNKFADLEAKEFAKSYNGYRLDLLGKLRNSTTFHKLSGQRNPLAVDWREKSKVTPIKNQGDCGSCWAFSTIGSVESQYAINTGKLVSFSEQQLIDCSSDNNGCNGGIVDTAFQYLETTKIETETSYPYRAADGDCQHDSSQGIAGVGDYTDITQNSEDDLLDAVANVGPISVALDCSHQSFQLYKSGVYSDENCSTDELDHGLVVVGYGVTSSDESYWLIKNSWGEEWGDEGYFKLARNDGNMCGIATRASYPTGVH